MTKTTLKKTLAALVAAVLILPALHVSSAVAADSGGNTQIDIGAPFVDTSNKDARSMWYTNGVDGKATNLEMSALNTAAQLVVNFSAAPSGGIAFVFQGDFDNWGWHQTDLGASSGTTLTIDLSSIANWADFVQGSQGKFLLTQWGEALPITGAYLAVSGMVISPGTPSATPTPAVTPVPTGTPAPSIAPTPPVVNPMAPAVTYENLVLDSPSTGGDGTVTWRTNGVDGYATSLAMNALTSATQLVIDFAAQPTGDLVFVLASETNGWWKETPIPQPSGTSVTIDLPSANSWTDFIKASAGKFTIVQWGASLQISGAHLVVPRLVILDQPPLKTVYNFGEDLDLTGMSIWYYNQASNSYDKADLTNANASVSGYNASSFGAQKAAVTYSASVNGTKQNFTISVDITVNPPDHDLPVSVSEIDGLFRPRNGAAPVNEIAASAQFTGAVTWSPQPSGGAFDPLTSYTATITLTAAPYFTFKGVPANFFTVSGADRVTNAADSGVVTAVFPPTAGSLDKNAMRDIPAAQLVSEMTIGWNLGNTFDATASGNNDPETAWVSVPTTKAIIDKIADAGFNVLRIPITWATGEGVYQRVGNGPNFTINPKFLDRLEEVVNYGLDDGMFVIINTHHDDALGDNTWLTFTDAGYGASSAELTALWAQIANRFKGYGDHLIFETMNEPHVGDDWTGSSEYYNNVNRLNQDALNAIRATGGNNDGRFIMLPSYAASSGSTQMNAFVLPDDPTGSANPKLIASVHAYSPYDFALNTDDTKNQWGTAADKQNLKNMFSDVNKAFISKGIPVVLGEFGAMNKNNEAIRAQWARYFISDAKQYGIPCVWWDNDAFSSGEKFGLLDRATLTFPYPLLLKGLMSGLEYKVPMDLTVSPVYDTAANKWRIAATIKNIDASNTAYSGTVYLVSPDGYTNVTSRPYNIASYGGSATLYFDINPSFVYTKAQEDISFNYKAYDDKNGISYTGEDPATVKFGLVSPAYNAAPPIMDNGVWNDAEWDMITDGIDLSKGVTDDKGSSASALNPADLSAAGKLAWDSQYLYINLAVKDNAQVQDSTGDTINNMWQGDSVQVSAGSDSGVRETGFALNAGNNTVYQYCWTNSTGSAEGTGEITAGNAVSSIKRDDAGGQTLYDIAIKWDYLGIDGGQLTAGDVYKLSICINDYDASMNKDRKFIEYGEGIAVGAKGSNMGYLLLMPAERAANGFVIDVTAGAGGTATGGGTYEANAPVTLTATPNAGYSFDGWYESNIKVSGDLVYAFPATADRALQARFTNNIRIHL